MCYTRKIYLLPLILIAIGLSMPVRSNTVVYFGTFIHADTVPPSGKAIFYSNCYNCHKDTAGLLAPGYSVLASMTPRAVLTALTTGKMRAQGAALSENQKKMVAEWVTSGKLNKAAHILKNVSGVPFRKGESARYDHSGWGGNTAATGFRTSSQTNINCGNVDSLKLKWVFAFPDATIVRSKPAVIGNWLIVGSQFGDVYAINRISGKQGWHFSANAAIRGAIVIKKMNNKTMAYFADFSTTTYAIDLATGKVIWSQRAGYEAQSATTGSVAVYDGKIFVPISTTEIGAAVDGKYECCTASGGLVALNQLTGKIEWVHRVVTEPAKESGKNNNGKSFFGPSGAPVWCSPTIDSKRGLLYIGTGQNYSYPSTESSDAIQALNMKTGKLVWNFQATSGDAYNASCPFFTNCPPKSGPDFDFGMAPLLVQGSDKKDILVVGQKSGVVFALSPDSGKIIWQTRVGKGGMLGGIHWGMASDGNYVYVPNSDNQIALDRRDSTVKASPGIFALDVFTGKIIWNTPVPSCAGQPHCFPFNSAAPTVTTELVFAGSVDGHMRAYSTKDGKIVWDMNTASDYGNIHGVKARGGSIDGPAPVVAGNMIYVNSGYGMFGQMGGNVLLAFGL